MIMYDITMRPNLVGLTSSSSNSSLVSSALLFLPVQAAMVVPAFQQRSVVDTVVVVEVVVTQRIRPDLQMGIVFKVIKNWCTFHLLFWSDC